MFKGSLVESVEIEGSNFLKITDKKVGEKPLVTLIPYSGDPASVGGGI